MALLVLPEKRQLGARDGHLTAIVQGEVALTLESGRWLGFAREEVEGLACAMVRGRRVAAKHIEVPRFRGALVSP